MRDRIGSYLRAIANGEVEKYWYLRDYKNYRISRDEYLKKKYELRNGSLE